MIGVVISYITHELTRESLVLLPVCFSRFYESTATVCCLCHLESSIFSHLYSIMTKEKLKIEACPTF